MISLDYEEIFSSFLGSVTDYNLASLDSTEAYEIMKEYLHKTLATRYVNRLFSSMKLDDDVQLFSFEMKYPIDENTDREFVINALAKWMAYEWSQNKVSSTTLVMQLLAGKEQKFYAQSNQLTANAALKEKLYDEAYGYIMRRGYIDNKYLEGKKS
jgi:hypothetical protein